MSTPQSYLLSPQDLQRLIDSLRARAYTVVGPTIDQQAVIYDEITSIDSLPHGWTDTQAPGEYRLRRSEEEPKYFGFAVGPHSWKQFLFPPRVTVARSERTDDGWQFSTPDEDQPKYALLGVRACELAAIKIQDRVFLEGPYVDPIYRQRRESVFIIAVNCTSAASTCFCTSMNSGPRCSSGFDLALTEIDDEFVVEVGSDAGQEVCVQLNLSPVSPQQIDAAETSRQRATEQISKRMDTDDIRDLLMNNLDHPRWDEVAERCLSCTNCTMVCPTCFCSTVSEVTDLTGDRVDRQREWDSCFNLDFSYTAGGLVRNDRRSRYRQWLTHKLASWHDQFESSGCVGCGRCITWCPVGIDLTEEVAAIRQPPLTKRSLPIVEPPQAVACDVPQQTGGSQETPPPKQSRGKAP